MTTPAPVRQRRTWDLVLTIILLVLLVVVAAIAAFVGFFLAFASDSCGASSVCNTDAIATGMLIGIAGPLAVGLLTIIAAVVVLVLRRLAFWIPLVGILLVIGVEVGAVALALGGVVPM